MKGKGKDMNTLGNNCTICGRINRIKSGEDPCFVTELRTGYVVLGEYQYFKGYTLFFCKQHASELHQLDRDFRMEFLKEMSQTAEAVFKAFKPLKLNYESLGNVDPHLHWHIFPRYAGDPNKTEPVWTIDKSLRFAQKADIQELAVLREELLEALS